MRAEHIWAQRTLKVESGVIELRENLDMKTEADIMKDCDGRGVETRQIQNKRTGKRNPGAEQARVFNSEIEH